MNRLLFLSLFFLATGVAALNGQTFRGGLTLGMVASQVSGDDYAGYNKLGFYASPYANFTFKENWRFQLEIGYIQKGSRENPSEGNDYESYRLKLNYVEVPMMFRWLYQEKLELEFGVSYGVLISSYEESDFVELNSRPFQTHNSSLVLGVYYNLNDNWSVNFRTSNSITPIRKRKDGYVYIRRLNFGQTNNILTTGLFYSF